MKVNTSVFIIGTVTLGAGLNKVPSISKIQFIGPSAESMIAQINRSLGVLTAQSLIVIFSFIVLGIVGTASYYNVKEAYRVQRLANMINNAAQVPDSLKSNDEVKVDGYTCLACKLDARQILFLPCKHLLFCRECFNALPEAERASCGKCRQPVKKTSVIYLT